MGINLKGLLLLFTVDSGNMTVTLHPARSRVLTKLALFQI